MHPVVLVVDTGTDDAGALIWAATCPDIELVGVVADWGNTDIDRTVANTLAVLHAAGRDDVPVFRGAGKHAAGANPARFDAGIVMGADGLNGVVLPEPVRSAETLPGAEAIVQFARERPGELTLVAVSPFTPVAAALALDPDLPSRFAGVVLMGGAIAEGGNLGAVAEANVGNDPDAASAVIDAFGVPGVLAGDAPPMLVPLDATHVGTISRTEIDSAEGTRIAGAAALHEIWEACWDFSSLEMGDGLPVHDLLAAWCVVDPDVCVWESMPVAVDTAGGAAWGMTVGDRRLAMIEASLMPAGQKAAIVEMMGFAEARWSVAMSADVERFRAGIRGWLAGE
jgi:inosine-uridine nucleoside N-ribohydrolase